MRLVKRCALFEWQNGIFIMSWAANENENSLQYVCVHKASQNPIGSEFWSLLLRAHSLRYGRSIFICQPVFCRISMHWPSYDTEIICLLRAPQTWSMHCIAPWNLQMHHRTTVFYEISTYFQRWHGRFESLLLWCSS